MEVKFEPRMRGGGRGGGIYSLGIESWSSPQDWNEGKEWKDKWMSNPPFAENKRSKQAERYPW
jgi:hypothetical protein